MKIHLFVTDHSKSCFPAQTYTIVIRNGTMKMGRISQKQNKKKQRMKAVSAKIRLPGLYYLDGLFGLEKWPSLLHCEMENNCRTHCVYPLTETRYSFHRNNILLI